MCGIAGLVKWSGPVDSDDVITVQRMMDALVNRGPDDHGLYQDQNVILGHRRLSIIDLSPTAHQPMRNKDGTVWVIYNGEIYNYRELRAELLAKNYAFQSQSDTEVLIHGYEEWGIERLLAKLRGMFAFVLYDRGDPPNSRLILCRDRLGIKPLYFYEGKNYFVFASEVGAIRKTELLPREANQEALVGFLLFGSVPSPLTTMKNIYSLPPAHYMVVSSGGVTKHQYWKLELTQETSDFVNQESVTDELNSKLSDSISRHLISDVPLGLFLSGGIDSGGLLTLASRVSQLPLFTLTVAFQENGYNEADPARRIAERFKTEHHEILVTAKNFKDELPKILDSIDQPSNDGVNTYLVSKAAKDAGLKVVLSGLGGDEVFWGYKHYRWITGRSVRIFSHLPYWTRVTVLEALTTYGRISGKERWMRSILLRDQVSSQALYLLMRGFFPPDQVCRLLGIDQQVVESVFTRALETTNMQNDGASVLNEFNSIEYNRYLHDQLLRDTDAFSMAHSIEVRVPYLDHTIVECAAQIPWNLKLNHGLNKPLLVNAVKEPLLFEAARRKKKGFAVPLAKWMKEQAHELEEISLTSNELDHKTVQRAWRAFRKGRLHWSRVWGLTVLGATRAHR